MKKLVFLSVLGLTACGTIFGGLSQDLTFDSNVKGVQIYVDGAKACKTPCTYEVSKSHNDLLIVAKKDGYEDQQISVRSDFNKIALLNTTAIGSWTTDLVTGGAWEYRRNNYYIDMEKEKNKRADVLKIRNNVAIRRMALLNYDELKIEAAREKPGEYIMSLAALTGQSSQSLIEKINETKGEVNLAHRLTGIYQ